VMVDAYVSAGYEKIHLDCSMGCLGEPEQLDDELAAERAARLAGVAERAAARAGTVPRYVVGTEVPRPGGAQHEIDELEVTTPEAVSATWEAHARAFAKGGVGAALERAVAVVAHPGVEFDNRRVFVYRPERAARLSAWLDGHPALVFEAHSTDYQPAESLAELVRDGFCILKVGPGLTFAMREALYGLDHIASALHAGDRRRSLAQAMEEEMTSRPGYWQDYYPGSPQVQAVLRHFSLSDRIRYYWSSPNAEAAVAELFAELQGTSVPLPLVSQFLPRAYDRAASQGSDFQPRALVVEAVRDVLRTYSAAAHRAPRR
jgi:D-tagatose-bisphosphate aldolase class II non-catalytic subunit